MVINILLVTNIYPNNDPLYAGTKVCHSFTREWIQMGYNIRVVHIESLYPKPFYWIGKLIYRYIQAKTGYVAYTNTPRNNVRYHVDNIPILFVPIPKVIPHTSPSTKNMRKAYGWICDQLAKDNFIPDVVTAHFVLPQLEMVHLLKQRYPSARSCLILHGSASRIEKCYPNRYLELMKSIDVWGFRSQSFKDDFDARFGIHQNEFICYSGIPDKYILSEKKNYSSKIMKFVFVGSLYKLKNVDVTIKAINLAMGERDYTFDIVGDGAEYENLKKLVGDLGLQHKVIFHGKKTRDDAQKILESSDCFIMVSSREAFGLVYVEAMAKGLIVIGTKGQGIDGVVKDGINGFLCESNNVEKLAEIIGKISQMSLEEYQNLSRLSLETAKKLTDRKVAEHYINSIINEYK